MPLITIQGTPIEFPNSGSSPNWSPAVIEFAQAVEAALQAAIGEFDVPPQVYTLTNNVNSNLNIPNLSFSSQEVRSATIEFAVFRKTNSLKTFAKGRLNIFYDDVAADWAIQREDDVGNITNEVTFSITSSGQIQITTTNLAGSSYTGKISYSAKALPRE